ncbi:MAG: hypothetical protein ABWX96_17675 [Propionibacteriaceae bacterium]
MSSPSQSRFGPRRATVAGLLGVLGAVVLAGGTGFAYAASTDAVESGYLTVVDEATPSTTAAEDCPYDAGSESSSPEGSGSEDSGSEGSGSDAGAL